MFCSYLVPDLSVSTCVCVYTCVVFIVVGVMIGNTDTVHYVRFTHNIYRFSPTFMFPEDLKRFHGNNERISIRNYEQAINFYYHLMVNADEGALPPLHKHNDELWYLMNINIFCFN